MVQARREESQKKVQVPDILRCREIPESENDHGWLRVQSARAFMAMMVPLRR